MAHNRGQQYQRDIYMAYLNFPGSELEFGQGSKKTDVIIKTPIPMKVESKVRRSANIAEFGSTIIHWDSNNKWYFPEEEKSGAPDIVNVLNMCGFINELNERWPEPAYRLTEADNIKQKYQYDENLQKKYLTKYRKEAQTINKRFQIDTQDQNSNITHEQLMDAMKNHYSNSNYIQINEKGLFRLGDEDPIAQMTNNKITFPEFIPGSGQVIFRLKAHGGLRFATYNAAIQFRYFPTAPSNNFNLSPTQTLSLRDLMQDKQNFITLFKAIQEGYFQNQS